MQAGCVTFICLQKSSILCTTPQNNTGKVIFEDNNLCCQFLNDYVNLPHFKDVRPEDIEDVSEEFVPLFSNEREADRVKEIKIRGENNITSFFLISLIEHKSNVEYNIHMQIFRYMVYIWERYEKQMERENPVCTRRKDFAYPPIIPIVYYEGKGSWTAPKEFKDKVMFVEIFKELLLKNTPDYLLDIIVNVLRAFLRKVNVPEDEMETIVSKVKEKKMGELFANMDKMDIQAERRKTAEAQRRADEERENGIRNVVSVGKQFGATKEELADNLRKTHGFNPEEAMEKVELYWN